MEICLFGGNPANKPRELFVGKQPFAIRADPGQFGVCEAFVDRTMADWVHRNSLASALGLGHGMMLLNAPS